ncbi:MAG: amino acid ABC transporter permease [Planctomycetes bacterium]|nr:amino acid ABC transporter permease [Planctomycetota bacterium]
MPLAVTFGLLLALMRMSRHRWMRWPAAAYIELTRGTPLLVQIFLVYYTLPGLGRWIHETILPGIDPGFLTWPSFAVGVLCLAGNYAAYEAEIHRAGIQAVDPGQREAALALGMSPIQAFCIVVLPQSLRIVVPPIVNDLIAMLKDTSLVMTISVAELMYTATAIGRSKFIIPKMMLVAAAIYLVLSLVCYALGKWAERRLSFEGAPKVKVENVRH